MSSTPRLLALATLLGSVACSTQVSPPVVEEAAPSGGAGRMASDGWLDATAALTTGRTPVYEGDAPMRFTFLKSMQKGDGLTLSKYDLGAHSGTHVDAPMHFIRDGAPIDQVPLSAFIGPALVVQIPDSVQEIDAAELARHEWKGAERILFRTRASLRGWMDSVQFHRDFAYLTGDAAQLLADAGVKLVAVDYISAEKFAAPEPLAHRALLGKGIPIVEGLYLRNIEAGTYDLIILPMKVAGHEASPARALLRRVAGTTNAAP
ncbi:MAG: cyclase family protein [Gemmatimonadaceae bacterium]|nr:cyclase family protein [Gemmatimonadaceae bacterium]